MQEHVQSAALAEGLTVKALLARIATEQGFTNAEEVGVSWWRKWRTEQLLPPVVRATCEQINNDHNARIRGGGHLISA